MKPGAQTTEFWLTVITSFGAFLAAATDNLPPKWAALASAASVGLYALARGWAKSGCPPGQR